MATVAAMEAGRYIQSQFDQSYVKKSKIGGDSLASQVVTEVDIHAQEIILEVLQPSIREYDLGLLTEEAADDASRFHKSYFWCIDPMDGTLPFTEHRPGYAVSIALVSKVGDPVIAVAYIPDEELCYTSVKGEGAKLNGLSLQRDQLDKDSVLHMYMDRSFQSEPYYEFVMRQLESYCTDQRLGLKVHADFGGVRNALGVINSTHGCYVKYPKPRNGCGSIWDYVATRLLAEELGLRVSNSSGKRLDLNRPGTTFMNQQGVLYATDKVLADFLVSVGDQLKEGSG